MSETFTTRFGRTPTVRVSSPGRINLIGDHLDYNGGSVLPIATPQQAHVELAPREDDRVRAFSVETGDEHYRLGHEKRGRGWLDYVQAVTRALSEHGVRHSGFDLWVHSEVPFVAGLSSSSALELAVLRGLRELWSLSLTDLELAIIGHRAETSFIGSVGIMDHFASSLANEHAALLLDTSTLKYRELQLPRRMSILAIDSGLKHELINTEYEYRRQQCEAAAAALGVKSLCSLGTDALPRVMGLSAPFSRRARHAITENQRVHAAVRAIEKNELTELGRLINESHDSLRDDFQVSSPAIDQLVEIARNEPKVLGARITGTGFGGAVLVLTQSDEPLQQAQHIAQLYARETQKHPHVIIPVSGR